MAALVASHADAMVMPRAMKLRVVGNAEWPGIASLQSLLKHVKVHARQPETA